MTERRVGFDCPFCRPSPDAVIFDEGAVRALWDAFPVAQGHALVIPRRHVADWFQATRGEHIAILEAIDRVKAEIEREHEPAGYNIGMNLGAAAGQTIPHLHVHVIPRYPGDMEDPRGGVRHVIPERGNYLKSLPLEDGLGTESALVQGGSSDPLLPHLLKHLAHAHSADIAAAFVLESGVRLVQNHLQDLLERNGRLRILTGDYFGVTEPAALLHLLDLQGDVEVRVFESASLSFHPKGYLFRKRNEGTAFVGSSNLTRTALKHGVEWNYRVVRSTDERGYEDVVRGFESLWNHEKTQPLTTEWIEAYTARRLPKKMHVGVPDEPIEPPTPHAIQCEALEALGKTRAEGNSAGLVVLATGLGKTWLSAFDSDRPEYEKILFVAHREEILRQAMSTFRRIRPLAKLGYYNGKEKSPEADVLFASVQTLSREERLGDFRPDAFDYLIVDEFHHAAADTYRRVIGHFAPRFLLGLTATPERTDGADLLALCGENLVYRADMAEGIERELLSPFRYFGVPDAVDYENIPWRSTRFDEEALTEAVATRARAENALEQLEEHGQSRTVAFCVSQRHADFMADYFRSSGLRAVAVHAGETSAPRAHSLERLDNGELDVICAVDMFNEGVDLPRVDTILMLRPTESRVLWLQQFGRGLRQREGKTLHVIDYIGNHRVFLTKIRAMFDLGNADREVAFLLRQIEDGSVEMPPGCAITYGLEVIEILRGLIRSSSKPEEQLEQFYDEYRDIHGVRPMAREVYHEGYNLRAVRGSGHQSWLDFLRTKGDLSEEDEEVCARTGAFIQALESTQMTKSYKMLLLMAMLDEGALPGSISLERLTKRFAVVARRYPRAREEVGKELDDPDALRRMLLRNPIQAWTGGAGTGGVPYFTLDGDAFRSTFTAPRGLQDATRKLLAELVEWRLTEYMDRRGPSRGTDRFVCEVEVEAASGANDGRPTLRLPPRVEVADLPRGWRQARADDESLHVWFEDGAVRVIARDGEAENVLPSLIERWFGSNGGRAYAPGEARVLFRNEGGTYTIAPAYGSEEDGSGPVPWW